MSVPPGAARPPLVLALDAATYAGSVALLDGRTVVAEGEAAMRGEREERLMPAVAAVLDAAGASPSDLGAVVCGGGPGSFTSLRIAAAIAKGIAAARAIPLHAVSSLWLVAAGDPMPLPPGRYLAALDAMRGEWFAAPVGVGPDGAVALEGGWTLEPLASLQARAAAGERVLGPGPLGGRAPHARGVARGGWGPPVALDGWEPDYGRKAEAQVRWEATHGRALAP